MRPRRLDGLVAIVTGGGQGIGRAIAARFVEEGASVLIFEANRATAEDAAAEYGERVRAFTGSVADEAAIRRGVAGAIAWGGRLDIVVNNAGIGMAGGPPLDRLERDDWQRVLDTNLTGPLLLAKHAAPHLRKTRGTIINISSTRAVMSEPNNEAYATTKAGLVGLTHALANSLGPDIRVNAIAPGWIVTDAWLARAERRQPAVRAVDHEQQPVGRVGWPEDVAGLAAYLASSDAGYATGQVFTLDGGMTRKMIYAD